MATMYSGLGLGLLLAGQLYNKWQPALVMPWAASVYLVMDIFGILRFYKSKSVSK